jgi:valyl-tRNA synthetase
VTGISRGRRPKEGLDADPEAVIPVASPAIEIRIALTGLVDTAGEARRIRKEIEKTARDLDHVQGKLASGSFVERAPPEIVAKERAREREIGETLRNLEASLARMEPISGEPGESGSG